MAFKNFKGEIERNLQEQVRANQYNDIALAKEIQSLKTLVGFDIKVIARLDTWEEPTGSFAFGDAIAVGPEGGPFNFYIYTRYSADAENGYWLNYGPISIVGPQGPQGEPGPQGETGKSSKWYIGPNIPTGDVHENDMWLKLNSDYTTNGFVYQYGANGWALFTSILGPQGIQGPEGKQGIQGPIGPIGPQGPQVNPSPVINIIGELPEGSVISDTYNPETVESNSGVLMPVDGINHLWIIINGLWTDSGSWGQGGTRVYISGVEQPSVVLDNYVKYPGTTNNVYDRIVGLTKDTFNTPKVFNVSDTSTITTIKDDAIVRYGSSTDGQAQPAGYLVCHAPSQLFHAANKQYVDAKIAEAHNGGSVKSYVWFGQGGSLAGGQIQLGIYHEAFEEMTLGNSIELPTVQLYYRMNSSSGIYFSVPYGSLRFKLLDGTYDSGKYQIDFVDAGAAVSVLQADCYIDDGILTVNTGYSATGPQYAYAALIIPSGWSSEW